MTAQREMVLVRCLAVVLDRTVVEEVELLRVDVDARGVGVGVGVGRPSST